jgi:signal transduction histidine kinase
MKKKKRVEQADRTERMVAALAHEIRNPLNSMKGASQYLHDKYSGTPEIGEFTSIIISEINRLESYLNEFLNFSRGIKLKLRQTDIEIYLNGIVMIVKHGFPSEIKIIKKKTSFPKIMIDQEQFRQVFVNLFSNARDALKCTLDPVCQVILDSDKKNMLLTVRDNGCGIPAGKLNQIFTPFYTTKDNGLGIGLSISRSIAVRHGGKISAKSAPGRGSAFMISLPFHTGVKHAGK